MSNVTRIKICGITNIEDARAAIDYGADALGFILVPETPRYVGAPEHRLSHLLSELPPFVSRVAVCAQLEPLADAWKDHIDTVQFYAVGEDTPALSGKRLVQAFRIQNEASLEEITAALKRLRPHALLLDAYHQDKLGGAGVTFNWELAKEAKARFGLPIVLAGGLTPDNVAEAVSTVRPYAVDVSSGVEAKPRHKDNAKLHAFIRAVRQADGK
jgi:phosphoribosylanthranilate isomerase